MSSHWIATPLEGALEELDAAGFLAPRNQTIKRVFEVAIAGLLMILAFPVALVIALAIVLETRGPVFFGHTRIGKNYRRFRVWKYIRQGSFRVDVKILVKTVGVVVCGHGAY